MRCARILWHLLRDEAALHAAELAVRVSSVLKPGNGATDAAAAFRAHALTCLGLPSAARATIKAAAAAERSGRAVLFADTPSMSPTLTAADAIAELASGGGAAAAAEARLSESVTDLAQQTSASAAMEASRGHVALARMSRAAGRLNAAFKHAHKALTLSTRKGGGGGGGGEADGGRESTICEAYLLAAELYTACCSLYDAERYLAGAMAIARSARLPRLLVRTHLAQAALHIAAGRQAEALGSVEAAEAALAPLGGSLSVDSLQLRTCCARAGAHLLVPAASPDAADEVARFISEALDGIAAGVQVHLAAVARASSAGSEGEDAGAALAAERAPLLMCKGAAERVLGRETSRATLEEGLALLSTPGCTARLSLCDGWGGDALRAACLQQIGRSHLDDLCGRGEAAMAADLLWRGRPAEPSCDAEAALAAARSALTSALDASRRGASAAATMQSVLIDLAQSCGASHPAAGARLLASYIGAGVRAQIHKLQADATSPRGDERADDADRGGSVPTVDSLSEAIEALSLQGTEEGGAKPAKGKKSAKGAGKAASASSAAHAGAGDAAETIWARSLETCRLWADGTDGLHAATDDWMSDPPEDCAICALALSAGGGGLMVSRWAAGSPPALAHVPRAADAGEAATGTAAAALAELLAILAAEKDVNRGGTAAESGEGAREKRASNATATGEATARMIPEVEGFPTITLTATRPLLSWDASRRARAH